MQPDILFSYFPKNSHKRYRDLVEKFGSLDAAWSVDRRDLMTLPWEEKLVQEFWLWKEDINEEKILTTLEKEGITVIPQSDARYPRRLKDIYDPPLCVFVRGTIPVCDTPLAVVGTRKPTPYGKQITQEFVEVLAARGLVIVSGLALGIDSIAHASTLSAGGKTIAVLGGGCDAQHIYPRTHVSLANDIIAKGGAVITEYPPGTLPTNYTFPARNRIIAGLSLGTLVIEAGEESGALITAQCALDANREVFAVPHPITSLLGVGPNQLIKAGAHAVTSPNDILEILDVTTIINEPSSQKPLALSPTETTIFSQLTREPIHVDMIIKKSNLPSNVVMSILTMMEMNGVIKNIGGRQYVTR